MKSFWKQYRSFILLFSTMSVVILYFIYDALKPERRLPIYHPNMVHTDLVDSTLHDVKKYHHIADFKLVNQNGDTITQDYYQDKIYVADFFFTTCPTICPIMTKNMVDLQDKIKDNKEVMLLSHTVTPQIDSVPQLKKYALEKGVLDEKWNLVTGDKKHIYDLARKSYLVVKEDGDGGPFDMIHTENFVLIDKEKQIRGYYDGTNPHEIEKLLKDIQILQKSYE